MPRLRVNLAIIGHLKSRSGSVNAAMKGMIAPRLAISANALTSVNPMTSLNWRRRFALRCTHRRASSALRAVDCAAAFATLQFVAIDGRRRAALRAHAISEPIKAPIKSPDTTIKVRRGLKRCSGATAGSTTVNAYSARP
jgi:hypothetical protein